MRHHGMNIPRHKRNSRRCACAVCLSAFLATGAANAANGPDAADPFQVFVIDRYLYDDNLFRIPDGLLASDPSILPPKSLDDYVNRASLGARVRLDASRQVFHADVRIDDVRYQRNDDFDFTGGNADVLWDWQVADHLSGKFFGTYDRAQASLSNYRFFGQDIVDAATYGAEFRFGIGSRWRLLAAAAAADTDHSAELRRTQNFQSTTGRGGIEYATPAGTVFALEYRFTDAKFPVAESLAGAPRGYEETVPGVRMEYVYSEKTSFLASAGYLDRKYDNPAVAEYSGGIWNVRLKWEPRSKLNFDVKAWHELKAYVDAESDYFVADGVSIEPEWKPTSMVTLGALFSYENQDYVGNGLLLVPLEADREDVAKIAQFNVDYTPRDFISVGLAYRWTDRNSNREFRDYNDNVTSVQLKLTF